MFMESILDGVMKSRRSLNRGLLFFFLKGLIMSRPKKEVTRDEVLRIKLTKEEKDILRKEAEKRDISMSQVIREAIEDQLFQSVWCVKRRK